MCVLRLRRWKRLAAGRRTRRRQRRQRRPQQRMELRQDKTQCRHLRSSSLRKRAAMAAISGYFKDPSGTGKLTGSSLKGSNESGTSMAGAGEEFKVTKENMGQLKEQLQKSIRSITDLDKLKKNIEMTVTSEGLRIELLESAGGTFFNSGSA